MLVFIFSEHIFVSADITKQDYGVGWIRSQSITRNGCFGRVPCLMNPPEVATESE